MDIKLNGNHIFQILYICINGVYTVWHIISIIQYRYWSGNDFLQLFNSYVTIGFLFQHFPEKREIHNLGCIPRFAGLNPHLVLVI